MFRSLGVEDLHVGPTLPMDEELRIAKTTGYQGIEVRIREVVDLINKKSARHVKELFSDSMMVPSTWELPAGWDGDESSRERFLNSLPVFARTSENLGCSRVHTHFWPYSDEREYQENFRWHVETLQPIAKVLKDYNCRLGLEWNGPKTMRDGHKYEFIHDIGKTVELIREIDQDNVGILVDSYHWYTSRQSLADIKALRSEGVPVVHVHLSDAPSGIPLDDLQDFGREVPGQTGVIDLVGFLKTLDEIGYDGPVTPGPPGSEILKDASVEKAAEVCGRALERLWRLAGLG